jgi:hypothetical protein
MYKQNETTKADVGLGICFPLSVLHVEETSDVLICAAGGTSQAGHAIACMDSRSFCHEPEPETAMLLMAQIIVDAVNRAYATERNT